LRWARLKAIVSLPQETFSPYGAGVKTSLVFLEKRANPLPSADPQLTIFDDYANIEEDYQVYMARIDNIGYDATGRLSVPEAEAHAPPEVQETIADFDARLGWQQILPEYDNQAQ
jgi:type I restriction enzyme M protein